MSAWLVHDDHLSALVQSAIVEGIIRPEMGDELWQRMKWNNLHALHVRYMDNEPRTWQDVPVNRRSIEAPLRDAGVYKSIRCWSYQCAEWDGFDQTIEHKLMDNLAELIIGRNGWETPQEHINDEPWGITEIEELTIAQPVEPG